MKLGLIGATGVVGSTILKVLDERALPIDVLFAYASRDRSETLAFQGSAVPIFAATAERLAADAPDVVLFASSDDASAELAEAIAARGAYVVDNSSTFRMDPRAPLVVPEINAHAIEAHHRIFPVANCTAIVLCMGLAPIARVAGLRAVRMASYQAVSGAGRAGLEALAAEEAANASGAQPPPPGTFAAAIARNVVPQVGSWNGAGGEDTGEEQKVVAETRKILGMPNLHVAATTVRVPVRTAHSEVAFIETERPTTREELAAAFVGAPGLVYHADGIVTPQDVEGSDLVHVARLRPEPDSDGTRFQVWIVGDQLRKGAATNGVQIVELLLARGAFASAGV